MVSNLIVKLLKIESSIYPHFGSDNFILVIKEIDESCSRLVIALVEEHGSSSFINRQTEHCYQRAYFFHFSFMNSTFSITRQQTVFKFKKHVINILCGNVTVVICSFHQDIIN